MWKVIPSISKRLLCEHYYKIPQVRFYLSESFKLENVWRDRFNSPILSKINVNDMFYQLDSRLQRSAYVSALDVDLFVNAVNDNSHVDEVEDVLHRFRLSPEAVNILQSTQHALIRSYIEWGNTVDLMRVLDDRLNYGIFPDDYCSLLMMDTFIKAGNYRDAAKVSTLGMLQENVQNPIVKYMSLYSCHKYLENPVPWNEETETAEQAEGDDEDEEEVVKVRVRYIRNPYFDDHFDLVDPHHLIGKTLAFIGSEINDSVGRTYRLLGLLLHDKFAQAKEFVQNIPKSEGKILIKDGLTIAHNILKDKSEIENKDDKFKNSVSELKDLINISFSNSQLDEENKLLNLVEITLKELVSQNETLEMQKQLEMYKEWEKYRDTLLIEQLARINKEKQFAEIQRQKQILQEKEEQLYFFDNEDKLDLIIEEKEKRKEAQKERERKIMESKLNVKKEKWVKETKPEPVLEDFFDENIPMKLVKTKL